MGQNTRLRLIRDRFVAGYENCALRRHLECSIRDIVDRCRVWQSYADTGIRIIVKTALERALPVYPVDEATCMPADRVVGAVTATPVGPGDLEALLRCLLPPVYHRPGRYSSSWKFCWNADTARTGITGVETLLQCLLLGTPVPVLRPRPCPARRDWTTIVCVFLWQTGPRGGHMPGMG